MNRFLLLLILSMAFLTGCGGSRGPEDGLEAALCLLDEEIVRFPDTMKRQHGDIRALRDSLESASDIRTELRLFTSLVNRYSRVSVDTMTLYSEQMLSLARQAGDKDAEIFATMALCGVAQMKEDFSGALNRFNATDCTGASPSGLAEYYLRGESVYYSLFVRAFNAPNDVFLNRHASFYREKLSFFRESYLSIDSTGFRAMLFKVSELRDSERYAEALELLASLRPMADSDTKLSSWHRYNAVLYNFLGEREKRMIHLALCSVYDLRRPTRDNLSLIGLARELRKIGELERASVYISTATTNSFRFKQVARMSYAESSSNKIMSMLAQKEKASRKALYISLTILALLLVVATGAFVYNLKLRRRLEDSYRLLHEADMIRNSYLFEYMVRSASYIDSADLYHKELRKMAKKDGIDKVYDILKLPSRFEDDKRKFYAMFDENFLSMFPSFIEKVNVMMKPEQQYRLVRAGQMPVELRVLAVMRMGMTDSGQIARFMSYSLATVYTYRCRAAEKSRYSREEFERKLASIPLE